MGKYCATFAPKIVQTKQRSGLPGSGLSRDHCVEGMKGARSPMCGNSHHQQDHQTMCDNSHHQEEEKGDWENRLLKELLG